VVGFDVFIGSEIGKRMEVEPKIVTIAWGGILAGLVTEEGSPVEVFRAPKEARTKAFLKQVFDG
jgi:ABC-type histidine transport system ATPase subunit